MQKQSPKSRRRVLRYVLAAALLLAVTVTAVFAFDSRLIIRRYTLDAAAIASPIRIALVTDLHSCQYGENQTELIDAVAAQQPDLVFLVGDIFDDVLEDTNTDLFLAGIHDKYPCYYVTGNHEFQSSPRAFDEKMAILAKYGIPVLAGDTAVTTVNGETVNICGVDDPFINLIASDTAQKPADFAHAAGLFHGQLYKTAEESQNGNFTVLLSHHPEYFETYTDLGFDLVLCGHAHGGQWRIPGVLNGLVAPDQGLFPKYAGGLYESDGTTMIVSRGLARETTRVPRIFNRPELVIVEIQ